MTVAAEFLRRNLSPHAYQCVRSCWWHSRFYVPRLVASYFVQRTPKVWEFSNGRPSELAGQLSSINTLAPTEMCRVMTRYGSDKGHKFHNYTTIYSVLFDTFRTQALRIFELGLGTTNPQLLSNMGAYGRPGASLRGWRDLFPHAVIYGADIDRDILFDDIRIETFYCDQLDGAAIRDLWLQPALRHGMDIIIDDGLHTFEANTSFLNGSLKHLRPGGIYVVEDICRDTIERWQDQVRAIYLKRFPHHDFVFVELELLNSTNGHDNNLLIVRSRR
jgi:hypothetical protein